jgi:hypothetical protein
LALAVENERGEWFWLNAEDQAHAATLSRHWVSNMRARGASCWRIMPDGTIAARPFGVVYATFDMEDAA